MNVASLELCRELEKSSGWGGTEHIWSLSSSAAWRPIRSTLRPSSPKMLYRVKAGLVYSAYDLGYLMRKLPEGYAVQKRFTDFVAWWADRDTDMPWGFGSTPEDAVAQACLELLNKGVLNPEAKENE